jgi:uncharacterized membrane protein
VLYLAAAHVISPRLTEVQGTGTPTFAIAHFTTRMPAARRAAAAALAADGVQPALVESVLKASDLTRVAIEVNDEGQWVGMGVDAGAEVDRALARTIVDRPTPSRARTCVRFPY